MPVALFEPITLGALDLANRVVVAPMCQYSAVEGRMTEWHHVHLGQMAMSGPGLMLIEATGVSPEGRITHGCTGLWDEAQAVEMERVAAFCRSVGPARIGVQLGHAGRKASARRPWEGGAPLGEGEAPWRTVGPSAVPYDDGWPAPAALDAQGLAKVVEDFAAAAARAAAIGLDALEVHCAHGYLLHQFLSPLSNRRNDAHGGDLAGRMRFPLEVVRAVRAVWPEGRPLLVRVSATDWVEGGWDLHQTCAFADALKREGVDAIHVSSGGNAPAQQVPVGPGYQTDLAAELRRHAQMPVIAVGLITDPVQAETILRTGQADMVALAREMLRDPRWVWRAAATLGATAATPPQYARAVPFAR